MLTVVVVSLLLTLSWLLAFLCGFAAGGWRRERRETAAPVTAGEVALSEKEKKERRELLRFLSFDGFDLRPEEPGQERK